MALDRTGGAFSTPAPSPSTPFLAAVLTSTVHVGLGTCYIRDIIQLYVRFYPKNLDNPFVHEAAQRCRDASRKTTQRRKFFSIFRHRRLQKKTFHFYLVTLKYRNICRYVKMMRTMTTKGKKNRFAEGER